MSTSEKQPEWEKEFDNYLASKEHLYDCIGYSEGQDCCLEKPWTKAFIRSFALQLLDEISLDWMIIHSDEDGEWKGGYNHAKAEIDVLRESIKERYGL